MVDDSIVRGTTTRGLVSLVRAAGAREVHMRVSSAPIISPCYYGIDTPRREELIAATMTHDELVRHLGVDSLGYLSLDGMLSAMPEGPGAIAMPASRGVIPRRCQPIPSCCARAVARGSRLDGRIRVARCSSRSPLDDSDRVLSTSSATARQTARGR